MVKSNTLSKKILTGQKCVLFELVPPPVEYKTASIRDSLKYLISSLDQNRVDGINIPEVIEESRNGERQNIFPEKIKPSVLTRYLYELGYSDIILNRPVTYQPWKDQLRWFKNMYSKNNIKNYVLVGGESHKISYPGYSVLKTAEELTGEYRNIFADVLLGGITIPTRVNEADRLLKKTQAGINFFTTQILYESASIKKLLSDYWRLCQEKGTAARMIFLSFAPVISKKDIELMQWLGVNIPDSTLKSLRANWLGIGRQSTTLCIKILNDIFNFLKKHDIKIPLGLNIGYVNRNNFEFSLEFLDKLSIYYLSEIDYNSKK